MTQDSRSMLEVWHEARVKAGASCSTTGRRVSIMHHMGGTSVSCSFAITRIRGTPSFVSLPCAPRVSFPTLNCLGVCSDRPAKVHFLLFGFLRLAGMLPSQVRQRSADRRREHCHAPLASTLHPGPPTAQLRHQDHLHLCVPPRPLRSALPTFPGTAWGRTGPRVSTPPPRPEGVLEPLQPDCVRPALLLRQHAATTRRRGHDPLR